MKGIQDIYQRLVEYYPTTGTGLLRAVAATIFSEGFTPDDVTPDLIRAVYPPANIPANAAVDGVVRVPVTNSDGQVYIVEVSDHRGRLPASSSV